VSPKGHCGVVGSLALCNTGNRNVALERSSVERREWRAQGNAAAGNAPSQILAPTPE